MYTDKDKIILIIFGGMIPVLIIIGIVFATQVKTCIEPGCRREPVSEEGYCEVHQLYIFREKDYTYEQHESAPEETEPKAVKEKPQITTTQPATTNKRINHKNDISNPYASYDEGYEDVYEGDDYDWDRYYSDEDYANGVDDAMDDCDW